VGWFLGNSSLSQGNVFYSQVTRRDLRPLDWHLIWPELADEASQGAISRHQLRPDIFGTTTETKEATHA